MQLLSIHEPIYLQIARTSHNFLKVKTFKEIFLVKRVTQQEVYKIANRINFPKRAKVVLQVKP